MVKEKHITIPQLASFLGISRIAVYNKVKKGQIPAVKIGRNYLIDKRTVEQVLKRKATVEKEKQIKKAKVKLKEQIDKLDVDGKKQIDAAIRKTIEEYGELLKLLGKGCTCCL